MGFFKLNSFYRVLRRDQNSTPSKKPICGTHAKPKVAFFIWCAAQGKTTNLPARGGVCVSPFYPLSNGLRTFGLNYFLVWRDPKAKMDLLLCWRGVKVGKRRQYRG